MNEDSDIDRFKYSQSRKDIIELVKIILLTKDVNTVFIGTIGISVTLSNGENLFFEDKENRKLDTG